jgi:hypothetical protein
MSNRQKLNTELGRLDEPPTRGKNGVVEQKTAKLEGVETDRSFAAGWGSTVDLTMFYIDLCKC